VEARITNHTDNFERPAAYREQMFPNWIFTKEVLSSKCFADNHLLVVVRTPVSIECLPAQQGNPKGGEIPGIRPAHDGMLTLPQRQRRVLRDPETTVSTVALSWNRSDKSSSLRLICARAPKEHAKSELSLRGHHN